MVSDFLADVVVFSSCRVKYGVGGVYISHSKLIRHSIAVRKRAKERRRIKEVVGLRRHLNKFCSVFCIRRETEIFMDGRSTDAFFRELGMANGNS